MGNSQHSHSLSAGTRARQCRSTCGRRRLLRHEPMRAYRENGLQIGGARAALQQQSVAAARFGVYAGDMLGAPSGWHCLACPQAQASLDPTASMGFCGRSSLLRCPHPLIHALATLCDRSTFTGGWRVVHVSGTIARALRAHRPCTGTERDADCLPGVWEAVRAAHIASGLVQPQDYTYDPSIGLRRIHLERRRRRALCAVKAFLP